MKLTEILSLSFKVAAKIPTIIADAEKAITAAKSRASAGGPTVTPAEVAGIAIVIAGDVTKLIVPEIAAALGVAVE
jgi:hypothetical protein